MRNIKKIFPILILLVILVAVFLTLKLSQERQEIRKKAATSGGTIFLSPSSDTRSVNETFPIEIKFNSNGVAIMGLEIYLSYNYSGALPEIEPLTIVKGSGLGAGWNFPIQTINKQGGLVEIKFGGFNLAPEGYLPPGDTVLATITFKANTTVSAKQINFNLSQTEMWAKSDGQNILSSTTDGTYTVVSCSVPSLPIVSTTLDSGTADCTNDNLPAWQWTASSPGCATDNYRIDRDWVANIAGQDYDLETTNSSFTPSSALTTGSYQFKVKAHNPRGWGEWSSFSQITLDTSAPNVPSLNTPLADSTLQDNTPLLTVNSVTDNGCKGEISYVFQIDNNSDFSSPEQSSVWNTATSWEVPTALANGDYYWRARAKDGFNNTSAWSGGRKNTINVPVTLNFSVKFQGISAQRPDKIIRLILKEPATGAEKFRQESVTLRSDVNGIYSGVITLSPTITIPPGAAVSYNIFIKDANHLQKKFTKNLSQGTNTADWTASGSEILAGDVWSQPDDPYHDNKITTEDVISVLNMWTDFSVNVGPGTLQDLNGDNKITHEDIRILLVNYNSPIIYGQE